MTNNNNNMTQPHAYPYPLQKLHAKMANLNAKTCCILRRLDRLDEHSRVRARLARQLRDARDRQISLRWFIAHHVPEGQRSLSMQGQESVVMAGCIHENEEEGLAPPNRASPLVPVVISSCGSHTRACSPSTFRDDICSTHPHPIDIQHWNTVAGRNTCVAQGTTKCARCSTQMQLVSAFTVSSLREDKVHAGLLCRSCARAAETEFSRRVFEHASIDSFKGSLRPRDVLRNVRAWRVIDRMRRAVKERKQRQACNVIGEWWLQTLYSPDTAAGQRKVEQLAHAFYVKAAAAN